MTDNPYPPTIACECGGHEVTNQMWMAWEKGYTAGYIDALGKAMEALAPPSTPTEKAKSGGGDE